MFDFKCKIKKGSLLVLIFMMVICGQPTVAKAEPAEHMTIYGLYLDTQSKGDAVLIESAGEYLLMDMGLYNNVPEICAQLDAAGVKHFKLYFSHLHIDHMGGKNGNYMAGLNYLKDHGYTIDTLYVADPSLAPESDDYPRKYESLRSYMNDYMGGENHIVYLREGSEFTVGYADFKVIAPALDYVNSIHPSDYTSKVSDSEAESEYGQSVKMTYYENNCCLVTRVTCDGVSYLTGGDLLKVEADYLVKKYGSALKSDIYKLSHHGTALGNSKALLEAIDPAYTFAINNGSTSYDDELKEWAFNRSLNTAKPVSMPYYVANEKKTIAYQVKDGKIHLYQGESLDKMEQVKGWIAVYGADGINRTQDYYYIGENGVPLTGIQEVDGNLYCYTEGGCMDYGDYDEYGAYLGWKEYAEWKHRYFQLIPGLQIATMLTGFQTIDGNLYYFDEEGWKEEGTDELDFIVIGEKTYTVNEDGIFTTNKVLEFDGKQYYFGETGEMAVEQIVPIDGDSYYFGVDGTKQYSLFVTEGENTYYFGEDGKMVVYKAMVMDGKEYFFDKEGVMACRKIVKRKGNHYYYGKYGTMVKDQIVKIDGDSYYLDVDGIMAKNQIMSVGTKTYAFDEKGKMVISQFVTDEGGNTYYFGEDGTIFEDGIFEIGADRYCFDEIGMMKKDQIVTVGTKDYYFGSDGKMAVSQFVTDEEGNQFYYGKTGAMVKDRIAKIGTDRYCFDETGMMVKNQVVTAGTKDYYFGSDGKMAISQFATDEGGNQYYFGKKGTMVKGRIAKIGTDRYCFDEIGMMRKDQIVTVGTKSYYFGMDGKMVYKQFVMDAEGNRYYFGKKGTMVKSKTVKIAGQEYTFDENGMVVIPDETMEMQPEL